MTPDEIRKAMTMIADGFRLLGFTNLKDATHTTFDDYLGVYLVMDDATKPRVGRQTWDENMWLRVSTKVIPNVGNFAQVDFRTGHVWMSVPACIERFDQPDPVEEGVDEGTPEEQAGVEAAQ